MRLKNIKACRTNFFQLDTIIRQVYLDGLLFKLETNVELELDEVDSQFVGVDTGICNELELINDYVTTVIVYYTEDNGLGEIFMITKNGYT